MSRCTVLLGALSALLKSVIPKLSGRSPSVSRIRSAFISDFTGRLLLKDLYLVLSLIWLPSGLGDLFLTPSFLRDGIDGHSKINKQGLILSVMLSWSSRPQSSRIDFIRQIAFTNCFQTHKTAIVESFGGYITRHL